MLTAIETPLYDVGVLSALGHASALDSISASTVLEKLSLLNYRNARGSRIHIRPSGEYATPPSTISSILASRTALRRLFRADCHLLATGRSASDLQASHGEARDQQDASRCRKQNVKRSFVVMDGMVQHQAANYRWMGARRRMVRFDLPLDAAKVVHQAGLSCAR